MIMKIPLSLTPPKSFREMSDGSTLPFFIKSWNVGGVYEAGIIHDWLRYNNVNRRSARFIYKQELRRRNVDRYKINVLVFGLYIYDNSPKIIQKFLQKTA